MLFKLYRKLGKAIFNGDTKAIESIIIDISSVIKARKIINTLGE